ncbi:hypothetical protein SAMN05421690_106111 [Nitrosomonas sp. Nm51]|uniref:ATP-binding protein n=1 Tax=Nitrosomonas sp. Nm51 TaxID=133720 RepID=UPI0008C71480|nr:ATP-binding protein [Nitrosomonas sp. Nm51]SER72931.1 hypothetical protein SAMN05421690_106111 [Nitrosomonas sp. Nm51]
MFDIPAQWPDQIAHLEWTDGMLSQLLQAESTERNIRSIRYQTQAARFPVQRHLQGFDFSQSKVDPQLIRQLAAMEFTRQLLWEFLAMVRNQIFTA